MGAASDYDEWAETGLEGAEQWTHEKLLAYGFFMHFFYCH